MSNETHKAKMLRKKLSRAVKGSYDTTPKPPQKWARTHPRKVVDLPRD